MKQIIKNCAIYTRKSTDERLDMDFNSLDAQREACLSYIASQKSEGWVPILEAYDDGGYSGGNMDRPALQRLLDDIKAGKIQTVVVYKIDRLTRSLMDFSKLVEVFDAHGVTFVSITQSFNTTTSMGRLTLNVLLSFAQFEREVTGERIRDKVAASKRKGMWMGGSVPLGYDAKNRQLVINKTEAECVRHIFKRYLELGSVNDLYQDLNKHGYKNKPRTAKDGVVKTAPFCASAVHYLLTNPTYLGKVRHKGRVYEGQHQSIIDEELWQAVQNRLTSQAVTRRAHKKHRQKNVLKGLLFNHMDRPYIPTYTNKPGKQYRYYKLQDKDIAEDAIDRMPAHEIEKRVEDTLRKQLSGFETTAHLLELNPETHPDLIQMIHQKQALLPSWDLVKEAVSKITIDHDSITIHITSPGLAALITEKLQIALPDVGDDLKVIKTPYLTRRAHKGAIVIEPDRQASDQPLDLPPDELKKLVRGIIWRDQHFSGMTLKEISAEAGVSDSYIGQLILKSFETLIQVSA